MCNVRSLGLENFFPHFSQCSDFTLWQTSCFFNLAWFPNDFPQLEQADGVSQYLVCFTSFSPVWNFFGQSSHLNGREQLDLVMCFFRIVPLLNRYVLSEKIGPNIQLLQNSFLSLIINNWTRTSILEPFWAPTDTWGALGSPGGLLGALLAPKLPFSFRDQF